jgi:predicted phosphodiesterase
MGTLTTYLGVVVDRRDCTLNLGKLGLGHVFYSPMPLNFRFAVISDLHIALPHTVWDGPNRLHLVEVSIPVLEEILDRLATLDLDFLLLPGDLTQHGELENHLWLRDRLARLPYPVYVIPGNHDVPTLYENEQSIGYEAFPGLYRDFGYGQSDDQHYYSQVILPGVRLIGLNSNTFDAEGNQTGCIDPTQMAWLDETLGQSREEMVLVMVHHNIIEHMPNQANDPLGQRYILKNADALKQRLRSAGVQVVLTGHLHIQSIAEEDRLYDVTTGSLVSYPHPFRVIEVQTDDHGAGTVTVCSDRVEAVPDWDMLHEFTRNLMNERSASYMLHLLMEQPWGLNKRQAIRLVPHLRDFWARFAAGDAQFHLPDLPDPVRSHFERFSSPYQQDNQAVLPLLPRQILMNDRPLATSSSGS